MKNSVSDVPTHERGCCIRRFARRTPIVLVAILLFFLGLGSTFGDTVPRGDETAPPPELEANAAVLIDFETGAVLYERDPAEVIPPASLTKLVSIHVACLAEAAGEFSFSDYVALPPETWAQNQEPGSSLMFLGPGQRVTYWEVLEGLAISSGNDAAVALAVNVAGSVEAFAERMNEAVKAMGLEDTVFVEPSGISENNLTTAADMARFSREYIRLWPENLPRLHDLEEFAYPKPRNRADGDISPPIVQRNRNLLVFRRNDVDGLKTGFIVESGYNLAATATSGERRLIAVVLGVPGDGHSDGGENRAAEAAALLDWGFAEFDNVTLGYPEPDPIPVFGGDRDELVVVPDGPAVVTLARDAVPSLTGRVELPEYVEAPIDEGALVGSVVFETGDQVVAEVPLRADLAVTEGGFFKRLWDGIRLFFRNL